MSAEHKRKSLASRPGAPSERRGGDAAQERTILRQAEIVAKLGLTIFWLVPAGAKVEKAGKKPLFGAWEKTEWTTPEKVRDGFDAAMAECRRRGYPGVPNLAILCGRVPGPTSVVVLDLDGEAAKKWGAALPDTPLRTLTGREAGGEHRFYLAPAEPLEKAINVFNGDPPGVDLQADGSYVVAPVSIHPDTGRAYREAAPWGADAIAELPRFDPAWLAGSPKKKSKASALRASGDVTEIADPAAWGAKALAKGAAELEATPQGSRDNAANAIAYRIGRIIAAQDEAGAAVRMIDEEEARADLVQAAERAGLKKREAVRAVRSGLNAGTAEPLVVRLRAPVRLVTKAPDIGPPNWQARLIVDDKGKPRPVAANVATILSNHENWIGVLAYNELRNSVEALRAPPWYPDDTPAGGARIGELGDEDAVRVQNWLARACDFRVSKQVVMDALPIVAQRRSFHPVREYLGGLRWDGKKRLDTWLTYYLGVEASDYAARVGRWWMISAVARVMPARSPKVGGPGCLVKTVLVLEGPQDLRKSTACHILGGDWFTDTPPNLHSKDAYGACRGIWIYELAELDALNRFESAAIKSYLSKRSDYYRPPYARSERDFPRQCVFIGSINPGGTGWSNDETGASRFWPVKCTAIDAAELAADRDQLWAEAAIAYRAGGRWWPEGSEEADGCRQEQAERYQADAREGVVARWLESPEAEAYIATDDLTSDVILSRAFKLEPRQMDRSQQIAAGIIMHRLGWERRRQVAGARLRVYRRPITETR